MNLFRHIFFGTFRGFKWIGSLPLAIKQTLRRRRLQMALAASEAERLDRIRNPSKYRGKDV